MTSQTPKDSKEQAAKVLYVRLPKTIKSAKEIQNLFVGSDVKVKLPRQSSRHCFVIFPSVNEKLQSMKRIKNVKINGKNIIVRQPKETDKTGIRRTKEKKIRIPKPAPEIRVTKTLHVSNIKPGTKPMEIRNAFPGCVSVVMMKSKHTSHKIALVKLGNTQLAGEYLRKERPCPEVQGRVLVVAADTRQKNRKKSSGNKSSGIKIYNEDGNESTEECPKKTTD